MRGRLDDQKKPWVAQPLVCGLLASRDCVYWEWRGVRGDEGRVGRVWCSNCGYQAPAFEQTWHPGTHGPRRPSVHNAVTLSRPVLRGRISPARHAALLHTAPCRSKCTYEPWEGHCQAASRRVSLCGTEQGVTPQLDSPPPQAAARFHEYSMSLRMHDRG